MPLLGTDIEQISRIQRAISRTPRFAQRVFTSAEQAYCESQGRPAQHYAARFCAKEAFAKALGIPFAWQDVEVVNSESGSPSIVTTGKAALVLDGRTVRVSLSHAGDYAIATVLIE